MLKFKIILAYLFFFLFPSSIHAASYYVDNAALGANTGTSWVDAWKSFADIRWGSGGVKAGDTLYISGGTASQIYHEQLTIGASGSAGNFITIDVGANSPNPAGHNGVVIIDGDATRNYGILATSKSYIRINGYDSSNNYKLQIQNVAGPSSGQADIYAWDCSYFYVDYVKINNNLSRGIHLNQCDHSRIRGSDIETGIINTDNYTSCIYMGSGSDNIVENNILKVGSESSVQHVDPLIAYSETRLTIRNNWMEWLGVAVDPDEVGLLLGNAHDWWHIYNNVVIGSHLDQEKTICVNAAASDGLYYFWNNTIMAKNPTGGVVEFFGWDQDYLGEFKNNVLYSPGGFLYIVGNITSFNLASKIDNNCIYRATKGDITWWAGNGTTKTWAQWQAAGYDINGINQNPLLDANYRLQSSSPCRNAGADLSSYFTTDKDGVVRPAGAWDIGAYEYVAAASPSPVPTATPFFWPGDINHDNVVNIQDYTLLSNAFGTTNSAADLNSDGVVNIQDYILLSNNFGKIS